MKALIGIPKSQRYFHVSSGTREIRRGASIHLSVSWKWLSEKAEDRVAVLLTMKRDTTALHSWL